MEQLVNNIWYIKSAKTFEYLRENYEMKNKHYLKNSIIFSNLINII